MKRTCLQEARCPIARSLDVIGDWWSLLIVRDVMSGPRRFGALQKNLGMAKNILAARLKNLVEHEVLEQRPASDGSAYCEYVLTERGRALLPVMVALRDWGDRFLFPDGAEVMMVDRDTQRPVQTLVVRAEDGRALSAGDTMVVPVAERF